MDFDWDQYPNFHKDEFRCRCGCGKALMDEEFISELQKLRTKLGFPFRINSGYRCPTYNNRISKSGPSGPHTTGKACDVGIAGPNAFSLARLAFIDGFTGVGVHQHGDWDKRYLHLDILHKDEVVAEDPSHPDALSGDTRPRIWSYP